MSFRSSQAVKLILLGSCRTNTDDQDRLQQLKELAAKLNVPVEFVVNQPYAVVQDWLARASLGIHTVRLTFLCVVQSLAVVLCSHGHDCAS